MVKYCNVYLNGNELEKCEDYYTDELSCAFAAMDHCHNYNCNYSHSVIIHHDGFIEEVDLVSDYQNEWINYQIDLHNQFKSYKEESCYYNNVFIRG